MLDWALVELDLLHLPLPAQPEKGLHEQEPLQEKEDAHWLISLE